MARVVRSKNPALGSFSMRATPDTSISRRTPTRRHGFTMVEVLIAIMVLLVGLLGILVLFPVGIQAIGDANKDSFSAIVADSVKDALRDALRDASRDPGGTIRAKLIHAGVRSLTGSDEYVFTLPAEMGTTSPSHPQGNMPVFLLSPEDLSFSQGDLARDPLQQYSFRFYVTRRSENTYEFWIRVYRNFPTSQPSDEERVQRAMIREYVFLAVGPL